MKHIDYHVGTYEGVRVAEEAMIRGRWSKWQDCMFSECIQMSETLISKRYNINSKHNR